MLSFLVALSAQVPSMADITANAAKVRANHVLYGSLVQHARPTLNCAAKAMQAEKNQTRSVGEGEAAVAKRLQEVDRRCHSAAETAYWASAVRKAYPQFSDRMAKIVAGYALSVLMAERLPLGPS